MAFLRAFSRFTLARLAKTLLVALPIAVTMVTMQRASVYHVPIAAGKERNSASKTAELKYVVSSRESTEDEREYAQDFGPSKRKGTEVKYLKIAHVNGQSETPRAARFVYLIQGPETHSINYLQETQDRDIIWLTRKKASGDIFFPNCSWTEGRNRLLSEAIGRSAAREDGGYLYYIFMDGDAELSVNNDKKRTWRADLPDNPFDRFELFLLDFEPAVGYPHFRTNYINVSSPVNINYKFDGIVNAFHRHTLSFLLPYIDRLDRYSWWFSQWFVIHSATMLYNSNRIQCNAVTVNTTRDTTQTDYSDSGKFEITRDYFRAALREGIQVRTMKSGFVFLLQTFRKKTRYDGITQGLASRKFYMEYRVSTKFIMKCFDTARPVIRHILTWRQRADVRQLLYGTLEAEPTFIPDAVTI